ncbi:---NA--- [Olea europaea subsp. europaea]|uniref:---NA n=1 Tax=Olea europaea subsp. europaea TaxID=158383 RepID=A0A8S0Q4L6_OLEEU|nr:---NA--- [Olea europaea subsp. europaea]
MIYVSRAHDSMDNFIRHRDGGALPRTIMGCLRCGQMGHYVIECTAKMLFVKEDNEERSTGEERHEHIQFAEVKRARDAVFDFGTHDYALFAEVGSSVSSQGQQGRCSGRTRSSFSSTDLQISAVIEVSCCEDSEVYECG